MITPYIYSAKYRNMLSKAWWVAHYVYDFEARDRFIIFRARGTDNFSAKVNDVFCNFSIVSSPVIMRGVLKLFEEYPEKRA